MKDKMGLIVVFLFVVAFGVWFSCYLYNEYRLSLDAYYTEYKLTDDELYYLTKYLEIEVEPDDWKEPNMSKWPDYSYYTFTETEGTEEALESINEELFIFRYSGRMAYEYAKMYGFSADNYITVEWAMTHPKEMVNILKYR